MLTTFKQKTAYEIYHGLVGSEMCIRDRSGVGRPASNKGNVANFPTETMIHKFHVTNQHKQKLIWNLKQDYLKKNKKNFFLH